MCVVIAQLESEGAPGQKVTEGQLFLSLLCPFC